MVANTIARRCAWKTAGYHTNCNYSQPLAEYTNAKEKYILLLVARDASNFEPDVEPSEGAVGYCRRICTYDSSAFSRHRHEQLPNKPFSVPTSAVFVQRRSSPSPSPKIVYLGIIWRNVLGQVHSER
jgi:hypothetical protein